jgi:hypothetical protein
MPGRSTTRATPPARRIAQPITVSSRFPFCGACPPVGVTRWHQFTQGKRRHLSVAEGTTRASPTPGQPSAAPPSGLLVGGGSAESYLELLAKTSNYLVTLTNFLFESFRLTHHGFQIGGQTSISPRQGINCLLVLQLPLPSPPHHHAAPPLRVTSTAENLAQSHSRTPDRSKSYQGDVRRPRASYRRTPHAPHPDRSPVPPYADVPPAPTPLHAPTSPTRSSTPHTHAHRRDASSGRTSHTTPPT